MKSRLQEAGLVEKAPGRGKHRQRRERATWPGMMLHQDANTHVWVPGVRWDLVVTMDDATSEHTRCVLSRRRGRPSASWGVRDAIEQRGLFAFL